jgi:hypothetical protein
MSAAQLSEEKGDRLAQPPALDPQRVEALSDEDLTLLLVRRFRAFIERGLRCRDALILAVTADR